MLPIPDRYADRILVDPATRCWLWQGLLTDQGYARVNIRGNTRGNRYRLLHRILYTHFIGPIPAELECDHLCRVRNCVNPGHLELVTHAENTLRGQGPTAINAKKTHCPNGHPYAGDNLVPRQGRRKCRACDIARKTRAREARRAARKALR